jgi:hypothetical protein
MTRIDWRDLFVNTLATTLNQIMKVEITGANDR